MNLRHAFLTALAAAHLVLVACGASRRGPLPATPWPRKALRWYGAMSGSDNGYGFFAPGVASQWRATFTLSDGAGRDWTDTLERQDNSEVTLRVGGIVGLFPEADLSRDLAASWAGKMFGRHPGAQQ